MVWSLHPKKPSWSHRGHHLTGSVLAQALGVHSQPAAIRPPSLAGASLPPSRGVGQPFGPSALVSAPEEDE